MRKRTKVYEHWEDAIDSLSDADRRKLWLEILADRKTQSTAHLPDEPPPTLH